MKEDLLHFIWKNKKLPAVGMITKEGESVAILDTGTFNTLSGPDFFNAKIRIGEQLWAGNVEVHIKSSDWYVHDHENYPNYDNVILHVVWEDDMPILRRNGIPLSTLECRQFIPESLLDNYQSLFDTATKTFINCEASIKDVDAFTWTHWIERLNVERLEQKSIYIRDLLKTNHNDWEHVLFSLLLRSFGLNINGEAFASVGRQLDFSVVRKVQGNPFQFESLLYGVLGMLADTTITDDYYRKLCMEYAYLANKFQLKDHVLERPQFFRLRPVNFPTIRLSQLANLMAIRTNLFAEVLKAKTAQDFYTLFQVAASPYWSNHFVFGKESVQQKKVLTKKFVDSLIINTVIPLKFCYASYLGKDINDELFSIAADLQKEKNSIIDNFEKKGVAIHNARDSQAVLRLYKSYCTQNKCLQCAVGSAVLSLKM